MSTVPAGIVNNAPARDEENATETTALLEKDSAKSKDDKSMPQWALLSVGCFLLISVGAFFVKKIEGWRYLTSLYVIVQIATTIGYGDFTVQTDTMKLFCTFYVLVVLIFISYAVNLVVSYVHDNAMSKMRKYLRSFEAHYMAHEKDAIKKHDSRKQLLKEMKHKYGKYNELAVAAAFSLAAIIFGTIFFATYESCTCSYGRSEVKDCQDDTNELCMQTGGYTKTWISAFYMSVITLTTVGFGDHTPRSEVGRGIGIVWMLLGVAATGNCLVKLTDVFLSEEKEKLKVQKSKVTKDIFDRMDKDGSGNLSRAEFRGYFLIKNGLVSQEDLDLIDRHYDGMKAESGGKVTWETIQYHHRDNDQDEE